MEVNDAIGIDIVLSELIDSFINSETGWPSYLMIAVTRKRLASSVHYIRTFEDLDRVLDEAAALAKTSDAAFREKLQGICFADKFEFGQSFDPLSLGYRDAQLGLYERIAGKPYGVINEYTNFDFDEALRWPFPYASQSASLVGDYLISYGYFIKSMQLPPHAKVLEIGSGYGPLTMHMASMGYQMTCLDISRSLLDYVQARTHALPTPVHTICGDMTSVDIPGTFDAVIFYESFHHCLDHAQMLKRVPALLNPAGLLAFAAEPIVPDSSEIVPYPWGLRMDGLSIWSIRRWGWLELGFQEGYFRKLLQNQGWTVKRRNLMGSGLTDVWLAVQDAFDKRVVDNDYSGDTQLDLHAEVVRLRTLVAGYQHGRVMRMLHWLSKFRR